MNRPFISFFVHYAQMINESKASLIDVTNELKTCQKEAKTARELRTTVARLQAEILKAGEMIIRLRRRLIDFAGITSGEAQEELKNAARTEELKSKYSDFELSSRSIREGPIFRKSSIFERRDVESSGLIFCIALSTYS